MSWEASTAMVTISHKFFNNYVGLTCHFLGDSLSTVEYYDPKIDKWHMAPPMSMMRSRLGVAVLKSKLYAFGGYNGKDRLSSVEVYDAVKKEWSMVSPMICKRRCVKWNFFRLFPFFERVRPIINRAFIKI